MSPFLTYQAPSMGAAEEFTGTIYYVSSSDGNDGDDGLTTATAWATCAHVNLQSFSPGDAILFKKGDTWVEDPLRPPSSGSAGNPITFGAYGSGAKPIFDANNSTTFDDFVFGIIWISGKHHITVQDIELFDGNRTLFAITPGPGASPVGTHDIIVRRMTIHETGAWELVACVNFEEGTNTPLTEGLINNIEISECEVYDGRNGIAVNGGVTDCILADNHCHNNDHNGIDVKMSRTAQNERNKRFQFLRNHCHHNGVIDSEDGTGIFADSIADSTLDGNILHDNVFNGCGFKTHGVTMTNLNWVIQRNITYNNDSTGLTIDSTVDSECYNNTIYNNGTAIQDTNNTNLTQQNNLAVDNGSGNTPGYDAGEFANPAGGDFRL